MDLKQKKQILTTISMALQGYDRVYDKPTMETWATKANAANPSTALVCVFKPRYFDFQIISTMKIRLVIATRATEANFFTATATGRSLAFNRPTFIDLRLFPENSEGLPALYNRVIRESRFDPATLVFAHDDLHILDFFWCAHVQEGLTEFDILGVAGNLRRLPGQPAWLFVDTKFTWDQPEYLSGVVGHGKAFPASNLSAYGAPRQKVKLLDGLFLACESETLIQNDLFFDERFGFHFYDLDFCRQAELLELSCGTWDLSLIHESGGNFSSATWRQAYLTYIEKWGN